jgi:integrase
LAGFLAGYTDLSREAYALDLRQFASWCQQHHLPLFQARRANIEALGAGRGHRTLVITRKGGKVVTIPLAPRTARAIDLAVGERSEGPVFLAADGRRLDRHGAARIVRRVAGRAGISKPAGPHTAAYTHHRGAGRWGAAARCAGARLCSRITEPHPRTVSLAGVEALADHLDLLSRRHLFI